MNDTSLRKLLVAQMPSAMALIEEIARKSNKRKFVIEFIIHDFDNIFTSEIEFSNFDRRRERASREIMKCFDALRQALRRKSRKRNKNFPR